MTEKEVLVEVYRQQEQTKRLIEHDEAVMVELTDDPLAVAAVAEQVNRLYRRLGRLEERAMALESMIDS